MSRRYAWALKRSYLWLRSTVQAELLPGASIIIFDSIVALSLGLQIPKAFGNLMDWHWQRFLAQPSDQVWSSQVLKDATTDLRQLTPSVWVTSSKGGDNMVVYTIPAARGPMATGMGHSTPPRTFMSFPPKRDVC
eukprot:NODE_4171_length_831_cov_25.525568_g4013_i0.p1 GENE.NODE_4171_length_831_cov_25.525568_g4013_i0~~NODE_4171_length_831_cov_25.525568_g4013_i0.p1  ORF type:complete len:152 (-),score=26.73 NODE_4171_length_831_cov_25.525568_g4013_i0:375-779(-)